MEFGDEGAVGALIFVGVIKGLSLCHAGLNVMEPCRSKPKTFVNVINITFYLG